MRRVDDCFGKDPLTGLLNYVAFHERLEEELRRAERSRQPVALVAIEVDAGDDALQRIAGAIRSELRPGDACGRVGAREFMIVLPGAAVKEADGVIARLRERTDETVSAGIAGFPVHALGREELVHLALGALSPARGQNRSVVYSSAIDVAPLTAEAGSPSADLAGTVHVLVRAIDVKDEYTYSHSQRVADYSVELGRGLGFDEGRLEQLHVAGTLHDVGKIGISDAILMKREPLTEAEAATMRRHSELGRDIIAGAGMPEIAKWVLHLHERWDGRGYPRRLAGEDIPLESRVLHCANALDGMTTSRVYRDALPLPVALAELAHGAGTQFDPRVVGVLVELVRSGELQAGAV